MGKSGRFHPPFYLSTWGTGKIVPKARVSTWRERTLRGGTSCVCFRNPKGHGDARGLGSRH